MNKKIELLSPVGGYEQFIAAVESGADAVYLGGSAFNARNSAANFSDDELRDAIKYAHVRGVKVHLTFNILLHDNEIFEALEFAKKAYSYGVDAFIVQDLGVIKLLRELFPDATLHFSTQGTIYSGFGVEALKNFNFERVVLSRELTLDEIEEICKISDTEIEVFVHGALCICYSGQCRFSSIVGGRSGNRGKCAQPCRLRYSLYENDVAKKNEYILSPKDLCGIHDLIRLIKIGVSSLKIEGRLKSPEYVACVTSLYRKYIDLAYELIESGREDEYKVDENDTKKLAQVFNRGGFSKGYYYNMSSRELMSYERPKHWGLRLGKVLGYDGKRKLVKVKLDSDLTMGDGVEIVNDDLPGNIVTYIEKDKKQVKKAFAGDIVLIGDIVGNIYGGEEIYKISDKELNLRLRTFLDGKYHRRLPIDVEVTGYVGKNAEVKISDYFGYEVNFSSEYVVSEALNRPIDFDNAFSAISKLGDTPFYLKNFKLNTDGKSLIPMSVLNDMRRNAVNLLIKEREVSEKKIPQIELKKLNVNERKRCSKVAVYLYNTDNLEGLELADRIYVPIDKYSESLCNKFSGKEIIPYLYTITKNEVYDFSGIDKILIGNIEHLELCKGVKEKFCDFSFNVFNSYSCKALEDMDIKGVNLSFELSLDEIKEIKTELETEVTIYGRVPLMISQHCVIGSEMAGKNNCNLCEKSKFFLEDRIGEKFPVITDRKACRMQILNSKILFDIEAKKELDGKVDYFRVYFFDEGTDERRKVLESIKEDKKIIGKNYSSGNFYRGV